MIHHNSLEYSKKLYVAYLITTVAILVILMIIIGADLKNQMTLLKWIATVILILLLAFIWFIPYKDTKGNRQLVEKYYRLHRK